MKVVMVGPYPEPGRDISGGVARVIDTLLPELAREVDLTLIVPSAACDAETEHHGVTTIYLRRGRGPGSLTYWTADARRLAEIVTTLAPDLVHLQGIAGVGRFISVPRILTIHGIIHRDLVTASKTGGLDRAARLVMAKLMRTIEARARRQIGNAIIINPYVAEALPDVAQLRQFAIPNPIDPAFCGALPSGSSSRPKRIISVGRIGPRKNTAQAVAIAAPVLRADRTASFTVYGPAADHASFRECETIARQHGVEDRVSFAGSISSERLATELDRSSVLLMTSRQETAPVTIAEAHARGVPVVGPRAFGIKHMITAGWNGLFLPSEPDIGQRANVLRRALDYDWDRSAIAADAQELYSPYTIAAHTRDAYRDVLGCKTKRVPRGLNGHDLARAVHLANTP